MKKVFYFLMAVLMMASYTANSQTVENNGVFSHMNFGVKCGASYSNVKTITNFDFNKLDYNASIELGKEVTPITGFSLEGMLNGYDHNSGNFGLYKLDVFGNVKFNLMNLFGGYNGIPRIIEIRTVTGIGWNHNFNPTNPNDLALQAGLEFDFNLGKNRNWYITFSPMIQTDELLRSKEILFAVHDAELKANLGLAYRFGRGNKSHNFKIVECVDNEKEYNELLAKYNELKNSETQPTEIHDTIIVENVFETVVEKVVVKPCDFTIYYNIGSSKISNEGISMIESFAKTFNETEGCSVKVIGSADSATGGSDRNNKLAWERANNVAKELVKMGIEKVETEILIDAKGDSNLSRCSIVKCE